MRVAVPDWQGRVSPVFDVAEQVVVVDLDGHGEAGPCRESLGSAAPHERARRLSQLGVNLLVCGAISWPLEALLTAQGIRVIPLICGEVAEVLQALRSGTLRDEQFAMPGCGRQRRYGRCRRRRRGDSQTRGEIP